MGRVRRQPEIRSPRARIRRSILTATPSSRQSATVSCTESVHDSSPEGRISVSCGNQFAATLSGAGAGSNGQASKSKTAAGGVTSGVPRPILFAPSAQGAPGGVDRGWEVTSPPSRLAEIRPLERRDLPSMAALFELVFGARVAAASPALVDFFERTLFDYPGVDPELPSLVALDERGRRIGVLGAEVRRMRFGERPVRVVWPVHLAVEPAARRLGVGAILLTRMLRGPQDLTATESGSQEVRHMWEALRGQQLLLRGISWLRVFRPWSVAATMSFVPRRARLRALLEPLAATLDVATLAAGRRYLEPDPVPDTAVPLTPRAMMEFLPTVTERLTFYPDYDDDFLQWLFRELVRVERRGRFVGRQIHGGSGRPMGYYLYYLRPGGRSEVLQVAARKRDMGRVLDHLFSDAYRQGSAAVTGRLEPELAEAVMHRRCVLRHPGGVLVHSRHPDLLSAVGSRHSLFTRLEGGWYLDTPV